MALLAVSKTFPAVTIREAVAAGQHRFALVVVDDQGLVRFFNAAAEVVRDEQPACPCGLAQHVALICRQRQLQLRIGEKEDAFALKG